MTFLEDTALDSDILTFTDNDDSPECSSKFFARPTRSSPEASSGDLQTVFNFKRPTADSSSYDEDCSLVSPCEKSPTMNGRVLPMDEMVSKRRQTKMLLVSLIESFCRIYGDSPAANHKVFFLICQTLRSLGFIDSEFMDEMTSVRSTFQSAFQNLFITAVQTVRRTNSLVDSPRKLITPGESSSSSSYSPESLIDSDYFPSVDSHGSLHHTASIAGSDLLYNLSIQNSRYRNDFLEISLLGRGGFASAYRARNKLDDIEYAIKKIRLGPDLEEEQGEDNPYGKIFREIKNLARLEHRNVIRYYSSWLEYNTGESEPSSLPSPSVSDSLWLEEDTDFSFSKTRSVFGGQDPTFDEFEDEDEDEAEEDLSDIGFVFEDDNSATTSESPEDSVIPERKKTSSRRSKSSSSSSKVGWTLFIQMQLCPTTLYDYIKYRNQRYAETNKLEVDGQRNIEIFAQILEGTAYIHEQGLIHRDMKPSNIFLSMPPSGEYHRRKRRYSHDHGFSYDSVLSANGLRDCMWDEAWVPKIGDFGLAATVQDDTGSDRPILLPTSVLSSSPNLADLSAIQHGTRTRPQPRRMRTIGVGTRTYASPEQMAIPAQPYDEKVDIYSLGIIFFELYQPFSTGMERADTLDRIKRGVFPNGFVEKHPKESALILWMMDRNPSHRPTARQLLEFELFAQPNDIYSTLVAQLRDTSRVLDNKTREVEEMRHEVERVEQEKQQQVDAMQQRLDELQRELDDMKLKRLSC
ncbi:Eukaryotic translation initiation factor 2-alpha kinase [Apophysomyces sp. BC1034]|nr:Eukaryotic translation initiation factor 2-alpha kinase [Apophysomyces sp. BC1015]KAG0182399.1 Eukaryotic translation initiation factor 2-alpha kinase [Apophysomyces sp. BC1021]KAG0192856.1 Eukaryotic translation initiation factor 2-alpha kinase [Apophysomyces sp. BC1034]